MRKPALFELEKKASMKIVVWPLSFGCVPGVVKRRENICIGLVRARQKFRLISQSAPTFHKFPGASTHSAFSYMEFGSAIEAINIIANKKSKIPS